MVLHWLVNISGDIFDIQAEANATTEDIQFQAMKQWMEKYGISVKLPEKLVQPCQWGDPCPAGVKNCGECYKRGCNPPQNVL